MRGIKQSDEQWLQIIKEFESSSLSVKDFCHKHSVGESTFYQKRTSLTKHKKKKVVESIAPVVFEPVIVSTSHDISMEINGISIKGNIHVLRSLLGVTS